jgi:ABC-type sugar transport system substrate-binding protein
MNEPGFQGSLGTRAQGQRARHVGRHGRALGVLAVAASMVLAACSSGSSGAPGGSSGTTASGKQLTIGFVVPLISNPYWKLMQDFAVGAAHTLGVNLQTGQADSDEGKEINIIEGMISAKVDGLVVGPVSDKVGATVLKDAEAAGIPVTFMQRQPGVAPDAYTGKSYVGFVGTDDIGGGMTEAQTLYDSGARKWVAMTGSQGNSVADDRLKAAQDFVKAHPDVTLLQSQYGNEARDAGQKTMENFLSAFPGPGFDAVYSFNDEGALGAIQALKNANVLSKVKVGAIDGTTDAINAVAAGDLITSVGGGYACGAFALVELFDDINGHPPKNRLVNIPLLAVTSANVKAYQDQVLNGMATYDFKSVSQVFTPSASTDSYKIVLK